MEKAIKIIFSDLDGTALLSNHSFSNKLKEQVNNVFAKNHLFVPISARNISNMFDLCEQLGIDKYENAMVVGGNGAQIYNAKTKKAIFETTICKEDIKFIFDNTYGKVKVYKVYFFGDKTTYSYGVGKETQYWTNVMKKKYEIINSFDQIKEDIHLVIFILKNDPTEQDQINMFNDFKQLEKDYSFLQYTDRVFELSKKEVSKGFAVTKIINYYKEKGYDVESYAFGDGKNDLSMFEKVDVPVAMGNAFDDVKACAKDQTLTNDEDGVALYIEKNIIK